MTAAMGRYSANVDVERQFEHTWAKRSRALHADSPTMGLPACPLKHLQLQEMRRRRLAAARQASPPPRES